MTGAPPYVGLAPFGEADADRFFGRDAERKRIIANLTASRLTLLYARSGVGKSSLLRAGVVARLAAAPGARLVPFVFSSWSGDPNVELPRALGSGGEGLAVAIERRTADLEGTLLVILDQFEEFFHYHQGTPAGTRFADELATCVQRADLRAHFLVSIREDAYSRIGDEFKGRLPNVYSNYLHLDDLDERGARAAIEQPLRQAGDGAGIEPELVDRVLDDVRRDEGTNGHGRYEAAQLQYVLRRLWDEEAERGSAVLRLATLEQLGGSAAIFERHFDEAVAGLPRAEQDALARAFRFLVTSDGTKRAESAAHLAELAEVPQPPLERALEHLRAARVLTPVAAEGQTRYELAHDLLAEPALEWRRERERARELRGLRRAAAGLGAVALVLAALIVWALLERAAAGREADRAESQALVAQSVSQLGVDPERSVALARDAWQKSETPQAEDALRTALAASPLRERLELGTTWRGALTPDGGVVAREGPDGTAVWRGLDERDPAMQVAGGHPVVAADGSAVATRTRDSVEVARLDGGRFTLSLARPQSSAFSANGQYVAALGADGILVADAASGQIVTPARDVGANVLAFDPARAERLLLGDCWSGGVTIWNWRSGDPRTVGGRSTDARGIAEGGEPECVLAVSPKGARAAQSRVEGGAALLDLENRRPVRNLVGSQSVRDLAWDADGRKLAVAAVKTAVIFDRAGRELSRTPRHPDFVHSVAFDGSGELVVTTSRDGVARIWDARQAGLLAELRGHRDEVVEAAFTADGRDLVTLSLDGTARSWRAAEGPAIWHGDWVLDAVFSPDGRRVATAAVDGTAQVTALDGGRPVSVPRTGRVPELANSAAFDADGERIAVAGARDLRDGQIVIADAATGRVQQAISPAGQKVLSVAFSPDGEWLLTTSERALTAPRVPPPALWRLSDFGGDHKSKPTTTLAMPERGNVYALRGEFSPDGGSIVTASTDGIARVYDARTRQVIRELRTPGVLYGATFSPDGGRILTYGSDFLARVWDLRSGKQLAVMRGHASWISSGDFSPDGRTVVTGSADHTTRVWDARSGKLLSNQRMHGDTVNSVAFGPDGSILSGADDGAARVYRCATCAPVEDLVRLADERIVSP